MLHGVGREERARDRRSEFAIRREYVPHISIKLGHYLTCGTNYAVSETEDPEEIFRMVLELSDNVPEKADLLDNCGAGFFRNVRYANRKEDIDNCILAYESAVHLTPPGHSDMSGRLNILGALFLHRFQLAGDLTDISDAISHQQRAVHLTPENHADMPRQLSNLGDAFLCRFECTGDPADISDAISHKQRAVHLTPEGDEDMPGRLGDLGILFQRRFKRTGDLADISDAISYKQRAVHLTPEGHADMLGRLSNLGNAFVRRFERTGDLSDITNAISHQQRAVDLTPDGHADMPRHLNNLGLSFQCRFERRGELADASDANHAISYMQRAVYLTPEGHADMPGQLNNLGSAILCRFKRSGDLDDIHTLLSIDRRCATCSSGPPSRRLMSAIRWARHSYDPAQSLEAYYTAIQLVSQLAGLEQTIRKCHTNLFEISDLATSAAPCAFKFGRPDLALEWLEQGRCLIWSQLNNLRTPLEKLGALFSHNPEIAREMLTVSRALENAGSQGDLVAQSEGEATMEYKMSLQDEANIHIRLAQKWNELLTEILTIPKFKDFLQPPTCSNLLKNLPESGSVAVVNVHKDSCDALVLSSDLDEPLHIPLHEFSYAKATNLRDQLKAHLLAANIRMRECDHLDDVRATRPVGDNADKGAIKRILHQLWTLVVKPILDGLGISVSTLEISAMLKFMFIFHRP